MRPTLFDPAARTALLARLDSLEAEHRPRWGRMSAPDMIWHVSAALRHSLGDVCLGRPGGAFSRAPLNWLMIYVLPWPKGAPSAPGLLATAPTTWAADVAALRELIERFGVRSPAGEWPPSLAFGNISGPAWGVLHHRHLDHHFRQFAV